MAKNTVLLEQLDSFLAQITREKVAAEMGDKETTHPSKSVDDGTQAASEGARSAENSSDVKASVPGQSVDNAAENTAPNTPDFGLKKAPTGEDPATEDDYKGDKDDPGTGSKMTTQDGEKYGSTIEDLTKLANDINATIVVLAKSAAVNADPKKPAAEPAKPAAQPEKAAGDTKFMQAGYETASRIIAAVATQKQAAEKQEAEYVQNIIKQAEQDATNLIGFLKAAEEDAEGEKKEEKKPEGESKSEGGESEGGESKSEGGESKPEPKKPDAPAPDAEPAGPAVDPAAAAAAAPPLDAAPPVDAAPAPAPAAPMADPGLGGGGDIGGGGVSPDEIQQIAEALAQAGIDPSVLAQLDPQALEMAIAEIEAGGGGMGGMGGMGEMGGGAPAPDASAGGGADLSALLG